MEEASKFEQRELCNTPGRVRTPEENKIILLALKMMLKMNLRQVTAVLVSLHSISWTILEQTVATEFKIGPRYVRKLQKILFSNAFEVNEVSDSSESDGSPTSGDESGDDTNNDPESDNDDEFGD
jgi:hypothetical protein